MIHAYRARVVEIANSWIGTPFHDVAGIKGVGVDCAHLIARVYEEAGLIDKMSIKAYSPQWFLHRGEEKFMDAVLQSAVEIPPERVAAGDIILYRVGRCFAHGAIVVDYPRHVIHAHKGSGKVVASCADHAEFCGAPRRFFSLMSAA